MDNKFSKERLVAFTVNPLTIKYPKQCDTPFIASIPHSGVYIPDELRSLYTEEHLGRLRNTDWHLPEIYSFLPDLGFTVIEANFSRYVIDVNRGENHDLSGESYRDSLVYTHDTWGEPILKNPLADIKTDFRIAHFYHPYHQALEKAVQDKIRKFGQAYVLDLHSFPNNLDEDICLGARKNNWAAPQLQPIALAHLSQDFTVAQNQCFSGGFITRHYGAMDNVQALQIELKYKTYMRECSANGDHMPVIDEFRANATGKKLKKALSGMIVASQNLGINKLAL